MHVIQTETAYEIYIYPDADPKTMINVILWWYDVNTLECKKKKELREPEICQYKVNLFSTIFALYQKTAFQAVLLYRSIIDSDRAVL